MNKAILLSTVFSILISPLVNASSTECLYAHVVIFKQDCYQAHKVGNSEFSFLGTRGKTYDDAVSILEGTNDGWEIADVSDSANLIEDITGFIDFQSNASYDWVDAINNTIGSTEMIDRGGNGTFVTRAMWWNRDNNTDPSILSVRIRSHIYDSHNNDELHISKANFDTRSSTSETMATLFVRNVEDYVTYTVEERDSLLEQTRIEGIQSCQNDPESCGITISSLGGFTQSEVDSVIQTACSNDNNHSDGSNATPMPSNTSSSTTTLIHAFVDPSFRISIPCIRYQPSNDTNETIMIENVIFERAHADSISWNLIGYNEEVEECVE